MARSLSHLISPVEKIALIVDNEPDIAAGARVLKQVGFECRLARSVEDAIPLVRSHKLVLVPSDINPLDGRNGYELARYVRERSPLTPVILMSRYHRVN